MNKLEKSEKLAENLSVIGGTLVVSFLISLLPTIWGVITWRVPVSLVVLIAICMLFSSIVEDNIKEARKKEVDKKFEEAAKNLEARISKMFGKKTEVNEEA